jgi:hypothetical protein
MAGPPRFLGDLRAHALLSDPDGTDTPSHYGVSMLPSAILEHVGQGLPLAHPKSVFHQQYALAKTRADIFVDFGQDPMVHGWIVPLELGQTRSQLEMDFWIGPGRARPTDARTL